MRPKFLLIMMNNLAPISIWVRQKYNNHHSSFFFLKMANIFIAMNCSLSGKENILKTYFLYHWFTSGIFCSCLHFNKVWVEEGRRIWKLQKSFQDQEYSHYFNFKKNLQVPLTYLHMLHKFNWIYFLRPVGNSELAEWSEGSELPHS